MTGSRGDGSTRGVGRGGREHVEGHSAGSTDMTGSRGGGSTRGVGRGGRGQVEGHTAGSIDMTSSRGGGSTRGVGRGGRGQGEDHSAGIIGSRGGGSTHRVGCGGQGQVEGHSAGSTDMTGSHGGGGTSGVGHGGRGQVEGHSIGSTDMAVSRGGGSTRGVGRGGQGHVEGHGAGSTDMTGSRGGRGQVEDHSNGSTDCGQLHAHIPSGDYHCHEKLYRELIRDIFTCGLCHELGTQWRYHCREPGCKFNVHPACGEVPKNPFITPFVYGEKKRFSFRKDPVDSNRYCVACGKRVNGYNYHCDELNVDLHPDCTRNFRSGFKVGNFRLKLQERLNGSCSHCGRSTYHGRSLNTWAYVSDHGGYQYFAGCLLDSGISRHEEALRPNRIIHNQNQRGPPETEEVVQLVLEFVKVVTAFLVLPS